MTQADEAAAERCHFLAGIIRPAMRLGGGHARNRRMDTLTIVSQHPGKATHERVAISRNQRSLRTGVAEIDWP